MRELQLLDREMGKYTKVSLYRKDVSLYQRSLKVEAAAVLQRAENDAKQQKLGEATVIVLLHNSLPKQ